jgi:hypothetical protein
LKAKIKNVKSENASLQEELSRPYARVSELETGMLCSLSERAANEVPEETGRMVGEESSTYAPVTDGEEPAKYEFVKRIVMRDMLWNSKVASNFHRRWTVVTISLCFAVYHRCPVAYRLIKRMIVLPSVSGILTFLEKKSKDKRNGWRMLKRFPNWLVNGGENTVLIRIDRWR